ncbi:hypothetical protein ACFY9N_01160 [Microbacterium sp. NPDC008134]|uniref:hypothetical protein n=1 Tax=Microbacterium sp. NPDC008134 TaxID=3364183 RepID=UPI0036E0529E
MSDRWWLYRDDTQIQWDRNDEPLALLTVFTEDDMIVDEEWLQALRRLDASAYGPDDVAQQEADELRLESIEPAKTFGYQAGAGSIRTRLALMGFSVEACRREILMALMDSIDGDEQRGFLSVAIGKNGDEFAEIPWTEVLDRGLIAYEQNQVERLTDPVDRACADQIAIFLEAGVDRRVLLALQLATADDDTEVWLDLHDLRAAGYFDAIESITQLAIDELAASVSSGGPIIVVTEGITDAVFLKRALELVAPHISHMFRFFDRDAGAEMGASQVVRTLRSFAAAGITNRVVGVLDNDSAGRVAERTLLSRPRPANNRYMLLPDVPYGSAYPTVGPSGEMDLDINGRAVAIEFQFGAEQLTMPDGTLARVAWGGMEASIGEYQGGLLAPDKRVVQANIERFLADASAQHDPKEGPWPTIHALVERLLEAAVPDSFPGQYYTATHRAG